MKGGGPLQKETFEKTALFSVIRGIYIQLTTFTRELLSFIFNTLNGDTQYISSSLSRELRTASSRGRYGERRQRDPCLKHTYKNTGATTV